MQKSSKAQKADPKFPCEYCACKPVCMIFNSTGGVVRCKYVHLDSQVNRKK